MNYKLLKTVEKRFFAKENTKMLFRKISENAQKYLKINLNMNFSVEKRKSFHILSSFV